MKKIRKVDIESTDVRFANHLKVVCDWVDPWTLAVVGGRGVAKSSEIQAERTLNVINDMPGAPIAFVCNTYVNLKVNVLPAVREGWKRKGCYEGIHYVCNVRPPEAWLRRSNFIIDEFKNTIFFYNGAAILFGSLDRPSLLAGKSVCHMHLDETKYQEDSKVDRAFPTLRGNSVLYGASTYFLGVTATTDMPDVSAGEYDWIFRFAKQMNVERVKLILNAFDYLNKLRLKFYNESNNKLRQTELDKLQKQIDKWEAYVHKARHEQTFFINAGSLANIQILTIKGFKRLIQSLDIEELKKSVLGIRPVLKRTLRFYTNLTDKHFYADGYNYDGHYDKFNFNETIREDSRGLKHIQHDKTLEAGFDTGNMKSFVVAQMDGHDYRLLKFIYTLPPHSFRELANQFIDYFLYHQNKELDLWYDRAANAGESMGEDAAGILKQMIERTVDGKRTGWLVNLKSRKQAPIPQHVEYEFMLAMLSENTPGLPRLRIDENTCKQVKSSMENAPTKITYKKGKKIVGKDKRSEKIAPERLPMESTNPSDAVKYLLCRKEWLDLTKAKKERAVMGLH